MLVYSLAQYSSGADFHFQLATLNGQVSYSVFFRPHLRDFLAQIHQHFDLYIYTSGQAEYAQFILSALDPFAYYFKLRLHNAECVFDPEVSKYLKNLDAVGRPRDELAVVDSQLFPTVDPDDVCVPVLPFIGNSADRELPRLGNFLARVAAATDFGAAVTDHFDLRGLTRLLTVSELAAAVAARLPAAQLARPR